MKKITLSIVLTSYMFGLTINEAVNTGLNHSYELKAINQEVNSQKYEREALKSNHYPSVELKYNFNSSNEESFIRGKDDSSFNANVDYNLFNGFIDESKISGANANLKAKKFEEKALKADIKLAIKEAYINLLKKIEDKKVAEESVELLTNQAKDATNFYDVGTIPKNEYLEVEVELSSAKMNFLKAKSNVKLAKAKLERYLGKKLNEDITKLEFNRQANLNENNLYKTLINNRSELKYFNATKEANSFATKAIRGEYFPTIDLNLEYARVGDDIFPDGKELFPTDEVKAGVTLNWSVFEGNSRTNRAESKKYITKSIENQIENLKEELLLQLQDTMELISVSYEQYEVAKEALAQAKENYNIVEDRYKNSIATTTTFIDARFYLTRAKSEFIQSIYNLHQANAKLERVLEK